jgi:hypothetical protein
VKMDRIGSFIRPETFRVSKVGGGLKGTVQTTRFMGAYFETEVVIANSSLIVNTDQHFIPGEEVFVYLMNQDLSD